MAWLARNKIKDELCIFSECPKRLYGNWLFAEFVVNDEYPNYGIALPSDADEKLIGKHLNYEDEPMEI